MRQKTPVVRSLPTSVRAILKAGWMSPHPPALLLKEKGAKFHYFVTLSLHNTIYVLNPSKFLKLHPLLEERAG
jgi:hypothetical protein